MEDMENELATFQAEMPSIYDDMDEKVSEISYLKNALEATQKKFKILNERQKNIELKMTWDGEDVEEELSKITTQSNAEIESIRDRLFQRVNKLEQELRIEIQENELVNEHVLLKKDLAKVKKDRDDDRERYLLNIGEVEQACRLANREKNNYRLAVEEKCDQIYNLETELEKYKGLLTDKDHLVQTLREELNRAANNESDEMKPSSVGILPGNLAVELSQSENLIAELRQERNNAEDDFALCKEHIENVLQVMEYAVTGGIPDSESGDGVFQLQKAIAETRDFLGLEPIIYEEVEVEDLTPLVETPENFDDLVLEGTGLDQLDLGELKEKSIQKKDEVPEPSPDLLQIKVVEEVSKIKEDIRSDIMTWIEKDRQVTLDVERSAELERVTNASRRSLEEEKEKNKETVDRMEKKMANLEAKLTTANSEIDSLKKQRQKDAIEKLRLKADAASKKNADNNKSSLYEVKNAGLDVTPEKISLEKTLHVHRLDDFGGDKTEEQRDCVTLFLATYSQASEWHTFRDPKIHTTMYMFEFDGSMWKTRISFLYPFVNYMNQVVGVNKKALGSVSIILPTSTVNTKINKLASSFKHIYNTLETHDSDSLWNYVFIFLKNVTTHYGHIKRFVGSKTRANNTGGNWRRTSTQHLSSRQPVRLKPRSNTNVDLTSRSKSLNAKKSTSETSLEMR